MILLDTNVLIYGFDPESPHHSWARKIIRSSLLGDGAAINPVILAEYLVGILWAGLLPFRSHRQDAPVDFRKKARPF